MGIFSKKNKSSTCHICGKELSKVGNYTNMILSDITDPKEFDESYGLKCAEHSSELTELLVSENKISEEDFEKAFELAEKQAHRDML